MAHSNATYALSFGVSYSDGSQIKFRRVRGPTDTFRFEEEKSMSMLTKAMVTTILPVKDMARARDFYENKLGLEPKGFAADGNYLLACGGDAHLALITKPEGTKAEHTALSFEVQGIERVISELKTKGVVFEDYDFPNFKTVDHVCVLGSDKAAWFKDSEGNYLCVHEGPH
jgi:catechol 2,3-dioxygenase-like lactoylglutathione lyase family enzyme